MKAAHILEEALKDSSLRETVSSIAEVVFDSTLEPSLLKDIPVLGTIVGVSSSVVNIRDRLYLRKLASLLQCVESVPAGERQRIIDETNRGLDGETSVGEKVLHVVDRSEDSRTARTVGKLFRAYLEEDISYAEFVDVVNAIHRVPASALNVFVHSDYNDIEAESAHLLSGTVLLTPCPVRVSQEIVDLREPEVFVTASLLDVTELGAKVRRILRSEQAVTPNA